MWGEGVWEGRKGVCVCMDVGVDVGVGVDAC